jgi:hypothetical protein
MSLEQRFLEKEVSNYLCALQEPLLNQKSTFICKILAERQATESVEAIVSSENKRRIAKISNRAREPAKRAILSAIESMILSRFRIPGRIMIAKE